MRVDPSPATSTRRRRRLSRFLLGAVALGAVVVAISAASTPIRVSSEARAAVRPSPSPAISEAPSSAAVAASSVRTPAPLPPDDPSVHKLTMLFDGDLLIHQRLWETAAARAKGGERFDFRPLLAPIRSIVAGADLAICHLETPLSPDDAHLSSFPVFETPHELADAIAWAGFDGCSTASNHTLDGGTEGVRATLGWLDRAGLKHAGSARSVREATRVTTYDVDGVRVAHLAYTFGFNGFRPDTPWRANRIEVPKILGDASKARRHGADLVVVSLHWGVEYSHRPTTWQREVGARLARSPNIDLIVGHHAHVVQPIQRVHGTWIDYGMGNLLSGMTSSLGTPAVEDGMLLLATAVQGPQGHWHVERLRYVPTWVEYGSWRVLPIADTLARGWPSAALRATLRASWARTNAAVHLLGAEAVKPNGHLP
jgi:hypothetical protein